MSTTLKIPLSEVLSVNDGLLNLDGYKRVANINGQDQIVYEPYRFTSGKVSWNVTKDRRAFKSHGETYREASDDLIKRISGGVQIDKNNTEQLKEYNDEISKLLKQEVEVTGILKLKVSELLNEREEKDKDGKIIKVYNPIPPSVLLALDPILEDDVTS